MILTTSSDKPLSPGDMLVDLSENIDTTNFPSSKEHRDFYSFYFTTSHFFCSTKQKQIYNLLSPQHFLNLLNQYLETVRTICGPRLILCFLLFLGKQTLDI
eukprot:TRINITY_DN2366_c0_g1_i1.p1 TRINITY_DN2366_c0_g1~~TRINITY_DN2366_c0_g1_i1.p1  ORF type:complete len:101 (-),score=8.69 TRINITY_DN2366_c0_g1_i1:617-919(-)